MSNNLTNSIKVKEPEKDIDKRYNKLIDEKSPYLLQHAYNPVNWYPWGKEAFEKAHKENKPIFLSIGYSTCHWCHRLREESFEDPEVAKLMNDIFISIKVDREERPDIDKIYMLVCQMLTGSGGWPLTIILTPEKKPFFAGTYFPKNSRFGRIGIIDLILRIEKIWKYQREEINTSIDKINQALQDSIKDIPSEILTKKDLINAYNQLKTIYDNEKGGFGVAPKFPTPHNLSFLLHIWKRTGKKEALDMVEKTLKEMRMGGIFDHIGFGFHRYSTDKDWLVPHYEKMLYDQALIALAYLETYQATKNKDYANVVKEIFTYILGNMISPDGAFYSAEDADSEGIEGKFYIWSKEEIKSTLNKEETELFVKIFNISDNGNYLEETTGSKTGKNILFLKYPLSELASILNINKEELEFKIDKIRKKLFIIRNKRIKPNKDDKILTDWNGLIVAALARGGSVLNEQKYIEIAKKTVNFVLTNLHKPNKRLLHRYRDNKAEINAFVDDYAFLIWGLIELYEATFETYYLKKAIELNQELYTYFWDNENGGFYFTPYDEKDLILRQKEIYDGALPSGNSIAMLNALKLSLITGNQEFKQIAEDIGILFSNKIRNNPLAYTQFLIALDFLLGPSYSVIIAGDSNKEDTKILLKTIQNNYIPNKTIVHRATDINPSDIDHYANFIKWFDKIDNKATAYICIDKTCKPPTINPEIMLEYLKSNWK